MNAVQWTAEPTLTEPAGENRAPEGVPNPPVFQGGACFSGDRKLGNEPAGENRAPEDVPDPPV